MIAKIQAPDPAAGRSHRVAILNISTRTYEEFHEIRAWIAKHPEFHHARKVNFFFELQADLQKEFGFEYYRTTVQPKREMGGKHRCR